VPNSSNTVTLEAFSSGIGAVSGAFLSGLSAGYQSLHESWTAASVPAQTKLNQMLALENRSLLKPSVVVLE